MNKFKTQLLLAGCVLCVASSGIAKEKKVAHEFFNGDTLSFNFKGNFRNATVSVTGPAGFETQTFQKDGAPTVSLSQQGVLPDGEYNYEIAVATNKKIKVKTKRNNGRGNNAKDTMNVGETQSGHFRVKDGSIVIYADIKEGE